MTLKDKPILLLAETGFIIRNLLLGYFAGEVSKHKKLLVAVQKPYDEQLLQLIAGKNIELIDFPLEPHVYELSAKKRLLSWDNVMYNMKMAVKDNASLRLQTLLFEGKSAKGKSAIFNRFLQKMGKAASAIGALDRIEDRYLRNYIASKEVTNKWTELLRYYNPSVVVSSMLTHSVRYRCSSDLPVIIAAKALKIKTCTLVQSWDNLSSKTSVLPYWVDRYYTWSSSMADELLHYNPRIRRERVRTVGSPQYDFHKDASVLIDRSEYLSKLDLANAPYVLIGTGTARWMPDEMDKMISLCNAVGERLPDIQCVIRLHPKDHGERWRPYIDKLNQARVKIQYTSPETHMDKGGFVPPADFYKDQVNIIYHAALVINSSSSITVDAAILDKPVICIAYDLYKDDLFPNGRSLSYSQSAHYSKLTATGGVQLVYSEQECVEAIESYLKYPAQHRKERTQIVEAVTCSLDLKAGLSLAHEVLNLSEVAGQS